MRLFHGESLQGAEADFAALIEVACSTWSSISKGRRAIGDALAMRIECRIGQPEGWLDGDPVVQRDELDEEVDFVVLLRAAFERGGTDLIRAVQAILRNPNVFAEGVDDIPVQVQFQGTDTSGATKGFDNNFSSCNRRTQEAYPEYRAAIDADEQRLTAGDSTGEAHEATRTTAPRRKTSSSTWHSKTRHYAATFDSEGLLEQFPLDQKLNAGDLS
jgi:hypothetical protein